MTITSPQRLDRAAFIIFQITLFIAPAFFIPSVSVPFTTGKAAFILYGILAAFILWSIARLKDGAFRAPKSLFYASAGVLALAYALAGIFSEGRDMSFSGYDLDVGTLSFFLPSLLLFALVPLVVRSEKDVLRSHATLFASFFVVTAFHLVRLVWGPDILSFGIFTTATSSLVGKWNDLGIFFGLFALLSLISLERLALSLLAKILAYAALVLSLVFLVVVNFAPVWIVLAILSLVLFVYRFSFEGGRGPVGPRIPYRSLAVFVLSVFFIFAGGKIGGIVSSVFGTAQIEARPSWEATFEIARATLSDDPFFGVGPNRFSSEWLMHKPFGINNTIFWNVDFNYGIGIIPSLIVSTGIVGFAAAALFLVLFLLHAGKALVRKSGTSSSRYVTISTLFGSLYLWIFAIAYVPSAAIWTLAVAFSGLFVAALCEDRIFSVKEYSTIEKPAAGFISVLVLIVALIGTVSFAYFVTVKLVAGAYFQNGVLAASVRNDLDAGEKSIIRAISLSESDVYYQTLAQLYLTRLDILFKDTKIGESEAQKQFQTLLSAAIQSAQKAVSFDPTNYANHAVLGRVFASVVPLNIQGAYESAKKAYESALARNPESPELYLALARLEIAKKDNKAAKGHIATAVEKKSDYADAIFLLSQIQVSENDVANAINSVQAVATLRPTEPGVFFQLGILYYSSKDYDSAASALERAVALSPDYANARYFLGLSYYQMDRGNDRAIAQFEEILKTNPENSEVKSIIGNLRAGKAPFSGSSNAVDRSSLPVRQ